MYALSTISAYLEKYPDKVTEPHDTILARAEERAGKTCIIGGANIGYILGSDQLATEFHFIIQHDFELRKQAVEALQEGSDLPIV